MVHKIIFKMQGKVKKKKKPDMHVTFVIVKYSLSPPKGHSNHNLVLNPNLIGNFYFSDCETFMYISLKICFSYGKSNKYL